jgi:hypothetical protein
MKMENEMKPHDKIIFPKGSKILINDDFTDHHPIRKTVGIVVGHRWNDTYSNDRFIDNIIGFSDGTLEPFANWEIYTVDQINDFETSL